MLNWQKFKQYPRKLYFKRNNTLQVVARLNAKLAEILKAR